ncbi:lytic murein transglycosylase [Candidatus Nomurabacteria bacterium]|nr:lytic murein transglycosylase [Candidatus Nomurabacteria bacterium]
MKNKFFATLLISVFLLVPVLSAKALTADERAQLEAELKELEAVIAQKQIELNQQKAQSGSIKRDIDILTSQIDQARADIKAKQLQITKLGDEIFTKIRVIDDLEERQEKQKESLAELLRKTNEINNSNIVHLLLSNESLSEFYTDLDTFETIKEEMQVSFDQIRSVKERTEQEKNSLEDKKNSEVDTKVALELAKQKVEANEQEKQKLLSVSKSKESEYATVLAERQKRATEIRTALFALRDAGAIPFGDALNYAEQAEKVTGVRAAFVLAIMTQESNLGANIGSCYLKDPVTGAGVGKNTGTPFANVMKPSRDVTPFLNLTSALGIDPYTTPVSCPWSGGGYGGGMGPAQFIPSTWDIMKSRVASSVGVKVASPWVPYHAIMASSLYLKDLGADAGGYTTERNAACRYYSGSVCTPGRIPANVFYGDQVMAKAAQIQANIDVLHSF